jgi:hypothetical protein
MYRHNRSALSLASRQALWRRSRPIQPALSGDAFMMPCRHRLGHRIGNACDGRLRHRLPGYCETRAQNVS